MSETETETPLFPLQTVLFPEGVLPLRVFEPRYLDMVASCVREERRFGVVLIREGSEVGPSRLYRIGTLARIIDWDQGTDGLLHITARGEERFRLLSSRRRRDGLVVGDVEPLAPLASAEMPPRLQPLGEILASVLADLGMQRLYPVTRYDDAAWVGCRLAELVPIERAERQSLLEIEHPLERLEQLLPILAALKQER